MVILIIGFQILKLFLCGIWNLRREKHYPLGSSDLVLHGSINQCVVNGRDAIYGSTFMRYYLFIYFDWYIMLFVKPLANAYYSVNK